MRSLHHFPPWTLPYARRSHRWRRVPQPFCPAAMGGLALSASDVRTGSDRPVPDQGALHELQDDDPGRAKKSDPVDHAVGFIIHHKVGDKVEGGEPLFTIHANDEAKLADAREAVLGAHRFSDRPVEKLPLFYN